MTKKVKIKKSSIKHIKTKKQLTNTLYETGAFKTKKEATAFITRFKKTSKGYSISRINNSLSSFIKRKTKELKPKTRSENLEKISTKAQQNFSIINYTNKKINEFKKSLDYQTNLKTREKTVLMRQVINKIAKKGINEKDLNKIKFFNGNIVTKYSTFRELLKSSNKDFSDVLKKLGVQDLKNALKNIDELANILKQTDKDTFIDATTLFEEKFNPKINTYEERYTNRGIKDNIINHIFQTDYEQIYPDYEFRVETFTFSPDGLIQELIRRNGNLYEVFSKNLKHFSSQGDLYFGERVYGTIFNIENFETRNYGKIDFTFDTTDLAQEIYNVYLIYKEKYEKQ